MYISVLNKIYTSNSILLLLKIHNASTKIKKKSPYEKDIDIENRYVFYYRNKKREKELCRFYRGYTVDEANEIFSYASYNMNRININGVTFTSDTVSKFFNVVNHIRLTTDIPNIYKKSIYFFGNCIALGAYAEDKYTIESNLQRKLNKTYPSTYRVVNCANWSTEEVMCRHILHNIYNFNHDLIIIISNRDKDINGFNNALELFKNKDFFIYSDISNIFQRPHNYGEIFFDTLHMQHGGYKIIADVIFDIIENYIYKKNSKVSLP